MQSRIQTARSVLLALLWLSVVLQFAGPAQAKGSGHKPRQQRWKQQIEDLEQQWRTAILNNDVALMDKLLSDDYVGISISGEVDTKTMQLDRLRASKLMVSKLNLTDVKVKLVGRVAIVTSLADVEAMNDGARLSGRFRYTRVYQKLSSGAWKTTNFEATRISNHDNGRRRQQTGASGS